jgi:hypothetical protein
MIKIRCSRMHAFLKLRVSKFNKVLARLVSTGLLSLHIISIRRVFCVLGGTNARLGTMPALPDRAAMGGGDTSHGLLPMKITRSIVQDRNPKVDNLCSPSLQVSDPFTL